ncbi:type VII secretion protein EccE [Mycolicibacterium sp. XJ1819]
MTIRMTLVLLAIVSAAMAYPWQSPTERWAAGIAGFVVVVALAWWRGQFVTTMIGRRLGVWRRNHLRPKPRPSNRVTMLVRVEDPAGVGLSLPVVAGYVDRFGVRCEKVRVTSRDRGGVRMTWISLTLDAGSNLVALQARSPELPLSDTAEVVARRMADHLREDGLDATIVTAAEAPVAAPAREKWSGVRDERGVVSVFGIPVDHRYSERLDDVRAQPVETWTAVEFGGTATQPTVASVCALRTPELVRSAPVRGLVRHAGVQGLLVTALDPQSDEPLGVPYVALSGQLVERVDWPAGSAAEISRT